MNLVTKKIKEIDGTFFCKGPFTLLWYSLRLMVLSGTN